MIERAMQTQAGQLYGRVVSLDAMRQVLGATIDPNTISYPEWRGLQMLHDERAQYQNELMQRPPDGAKIPNKVR